MKKMGYLTAMFPLAFFWANAAYGAGADRVSAEHVGRGPDFCRSLGNSEGLF